MLLQYLVLLQQLSRLVLWQMRLVELVVVEDGIHATCVMDMAGENAHFVVEKDMWKREMALKKCVPTVTVRGDSNVGIAEEVRKHVPHAMERESKEKFKEKRPRKLLRGRF